MQSQDALDPHDDPRSMEDVAVVDLVGAFAFELALKLHSYLEGWGVWEQGRDEMDGIWRERTGVDEQEGGNDRQNKTSNYNRTLSTSNGLLNKQATLVETPPSRNSCSQVF